MPSNKPKQKRNGNTKKKNHSERSIIIKDDDSHVPEKPYEVKHSDIFGRFLVASRDLMASEIVIQQKPLVIGPIANSESLPICLNCYQSVGSFSNAFRCPECKFPLCSRNVCNGTDHTSAECQFFKHHNLSQYLHWQANEKFELQHDYEAIIILRCLLLKTFSTQSWEKLNEMEAHNEIRKEIPALWDRNQRIIVDRIRNQWQMSQFDEMEIHTVCGILEVNCFEVGGGHNGNTARALFPEAYLMLHDCVPNTNHTDDPVTHELIVRTTKPLKKGDPISLSYAYTLQGTLKRRQHLHEAKFFWCNCVRCASYDELGTHASTLLCPKCPGFIMSTNTLDAHAEWRCRKCSFTLGASFVLSSLTQLYDELDAIGGNDVNQIETFMKKYAKTLHKNHYIFLSAKHSLCQLYGKIDGFLINELSIEQLRRKEAYCRDLLNVIDVLEPDNSRLRGVILYELHAPVMIQITRELQMGNIKNVEFRKRVREVMQILEKSYEILKHEPSGSQEKAMADAAKLAIESIGAQ